MTALPAVRQLVFLAADLDSTLAAARRGLGLNEGVDDAEGMAKLGFIHQVLAIDQTFLEFTAPLGPDTMPAKLVAKRGDLGYMVVMQVDDIEAAKARAAARGLKPVYETPYEGHTITQWHPRDFGTLAEIDQLRPSDTWYMAPRIFEVGSTKVVGDFTAIELAVRDPVGDRGDLGRGARHPGRLRRREPRPVRTGGAVHPGRPRAAARGWWRSSCRRPTAARPGARSVVRGAVPADLMRQRGQC